jgi:hypothetical protein
MWKPPHLKTLWVPRPCYGEGGGCVASMSMATVCSNGLWMLYNKIYLPGTVIFLCVNSDQSVNQCINIHKCYNSNNRTSHILCMHEFLLYLLHSRSSFPLFHSCICILSHPFYCPSFLSPFCSFTLKLLSYLISSFHSCYLIPHLSSSVTSPSDVTVCEMSDRIFTQSIIWEDFTWN